MQRIINDANLVVEDMLKGFVKAHGDIMAPTENSRVLKYKNAMVPSEIAAAPDSEAAKMAAAKPYLQIIEWGAADVNPDAQQLGLTGSPTKVKKIENVVFQLKESKCLSCTDDEINALIVELIDTHTLG